MTHEERGLRAAREFLPKAECESAVEALAAIIHKALLESSNEDLDHRRDLEAQLLNIKAGTPIVRCDKDRTQLRVWNPIRGQWAATDMIHEPRK